MSPTICAVPDIAVIAVYGEDSTAFLQAQLSQDIASLATNRSTLAAWHDPRGRVRAVFRVFGAEDGWLLTTDVSIASDTVTALRAFVLRSRVSLSILPDWRAFALLGRSEDYLAAKGIDLDETPGATIRVGDCDWLRIGTALVQVLGPLAALDASTLEVTAEPAVAASAEIRLGLPNVSAATTGTYIPQMLNLDKLNAIAFDKGCYPGQEVIARTHNLGSVKRRANAFHTQSTEVALGDRIVNADGDIQGEVMRVAVLADGADLLAVVRQESLAHPLFLDRPHALALARLELPTD